MLSEDEKEHKRLCDAVESLLDVVCPDFAGDMPTAVDEIARILKLKLDVEDPSIIDIAQAVDELSR